MDTVLRHRKYRLAGRLTADFASRIGLWTAVAVAVALAAEAAFHLLLDERAPFANFVFFAVPVVVAATAWIHLRKSFPAAIAAGITRREMLISYALFGLAVVAAAALLVQVGGALQTLIPGAAEDFDFYGSGPLESLTRPLLYFTAGAAASALVLRARRDLLKGVLAALVVSAVVYRQIPVNIILNETRGTSSDEVLLAEWPSSMALLAPVDLALSAVFAALAWAVLARAPMTQSRC